MTDDDDLAVMVLCDPITESIRKLWGRARRAPSNTDEKIEKLKKDATKAGYDDVSQYYLDKLMKHPAHLKASARLYQQCVEQSGEEDSICKLYKDYWLKCKAAQSA